MYFSVDNLTSYPRNYTYTHPQHKLHNTLFILPLKWVPKIQKKKM